MPPSLDFAVGAHDVAAQLVVDTMLDANLADSAHQTDPSPSNFAELQNAVRSCIDAHGSAIQAADSVIDAGLRAGTPPAAIASMRTARAGYVRGAQQLQEVFDRLRPHK